MLRISSTSSLNSECWPFLLLLILLTNWILIIFHNHTICIKSVFIPLFSMLIFKNYLQISGDLVYKLPFLLLFLQVGSLYYHLINLRLLINLWLFIFICWILQNIIISLIIIPLLFAFELVILLLFRVLYMKIIIIRTRTILLTCGPHIAHLLQSLNQRLHVLILFCIDFMIVGTQLLSDSLYDLFIIKYYILFTFPFDASMRFYVLLFFLFCHSCINVVEKLLNIDVCIKLMKIFHDLIHLRAWVI